MAERSPDRLVDHKGLVAICVGLNLAEAIAVGLVGPRSGLSLAPQASAVVPFGVFQDLRWLIVYSNSWADLLAEGLALVVLRSAITAVSVRAAWPQGARPQGARPQGAAPGSFLRCWGRAAVFGVAAAVLLAPMAVLLFGSAVAPVSWFFLAAVPAALVIALLFHHAAISPGWWRQGMSLRALWWVFVQFVVATASAAVIAAVPTAWAVVIAAATGAINALAWCGLVKAVLSLGARRGLHPVAPIGLIGFAGVVIGGTVLGFAAVATPRAQGGRAVQSMLSATQRQGAYPTPGQGAYATLGQGGRRAAGLLAARDPAVAVLVVDGYGTHWDGAPEHELPGPYFEQTFSYRGLGADLQPLAYTAADTNQPLVDVERLMAAQVDALHRTSQEPVAIVAESEGSLVARAYLAASPGAPVRYLVLTSPLLSAGRVYYPPLGRPGWGMAGGNGMLGLADVLNSVAPIPLSPTSPFLRSVMDEAALLRPLWSCPLAGVDQSAILPLADAVASPSDHLIGVPTIVLPAFHGGMLTNPRADGAIASLLGETGLPPTPVWSFADGVIRAAASAWQAPSLARALEPSAMQARLGARPRVSACSAADATLQAQLGASPAPALRAERPSSRW